MFHRVTKITFAEKTSELSLHVMYISSLLQEMIIYIDPTMNENESSAKSGQFVNKSADNIRAQ